MKTEISVRPYRPGNEAEILELFQDVFGRPMPEDYWQWRFSDNPTKQIVIDLAWHDDLLASHYAVSPVVLHIDGEDTLSALSMTTMTHQDFRGHGLFLRLAESVYSRMAAKDMKMVWGFPNVLSHRGFVKYLNWSDISEVPTFRFVFSEVRPLPKPSSHIIELESFDARFDQLWETVKDEYPVLTKRDRSYLSWRYERNPGNTYLLISYLRDNRVLGYAVYKHYEQVVDLVDLLYVEDEIGLDLVIGVAHRAQQKNAQAINMWLNFMLPLHRKLEKLGFKNSEPITYFGARVFGSSLNPSKVCDYKNWYLTMGDSDVY